MKSSRQTRKTPTRRRTATKPRNADLAVEVGVSTVSNRALEKLRTGVIHALPYQQRWIDDDSKLKVAVWARQSGKSFAAALRAAIECLGRRTQYIVLSKGERQSRLFMEKVKAVCEVLNAVSTLREFPTVERPEEKALEVSFPSTGSRIIGLPANPDTARGYSGNIILDEFAFHGDADKIFAACFPMITRGYSIEVISTPNGTTGKFYELAKQAGLVDGRRQTVDGENPHCIDGQHNPAGDEPRMPSAVYRLPAAWSGHRVDIYDALDQGLDVELKLLRAGCDDEETWQQEYCCQFVSDAQNYLTLDLIANCVHDGATAVWPESGIRNPESGTRATGPGERELYLGVDIGRKRDLTIAWLFEKLGDVLWSRVLLTLKGVAFDVQEKAISDLIDTGGLTDPVSRVPVCRVPSAVRRVCVDQSGLGMMLAEHLVQKYGALVEPIQFTAPLKERLAPLVKQAFEERRVRIPDDRDVRADLNSVKRFVTLAGNIRFDAEHSDRGHADRFWALAQVLHAATKPTPHFDDVGSLVGSPVLSGFAGVVL